MQRTRKSSLGGKENVHNLREQLGQTKKELEVDIFVLVIAQTVGWAKPDPIHGMAITVGESTHCHLR
jgi:hypothetical protein